MTYIKMNRLGLAETGRHCTYLQEDNKMPQQFRGHFMSHQLDSTVAYNKHDMISVSYQFGGTASLATGNLLGRKIGSVSDATGIGRWSWKIFRVQGNATLRIATFYRPILPNQGGGIWSVYAQHLTLFNKTGRRECQIHTFLLLFVKAISTWSKDWDQIIVSGDLNEQINGKRWKATLQR